MNLQQFIENARRGTYQNRLDGIIQKADDPLLTSDFYYAAYGQKVWDALNSTPYFFNLLRKVPFGRPGWRVRGTRHTSAAIAENGVIPDDTSVAPIQYHSKPRGIVTPFAVSSESEFLSKADYGIGDAMAVEQELAALDHVDAINKLLVKPSVATCTTGGASGTAVLYPYGAFGAGDTFKGTGASSAAIYTVTAHNPTTGVVTFTGGGGNLVSGNYYTVQSRVSPTSIDDIVAAAGTYGSLAQSGVDALCYDIPTRTGISASYVSANGGTLRSLTLAMLDTAIAQSRRNGGAPDVVYTTPEQVDKIGYLVGTNNYLIDHKEFVKKVGLTETLPGGAGGLRFATYKGLALVGDPNAPLSFADDGSAGGGKVYVLDTNHIEIAVAHTSRYTESRDFIANGSLTIKGLFDTSMELRCYNIAAQSKIEDLSA